MHKIQQLIREVNRTHSGLGPMIAINILGAKAKKAVLNIAPAGCGKSIAQKTVTYFLKEKSKAFTSLTLAGMFRLKDEFKEYDGYVAIDDLGAEKSLWSRLSTITTLANLVYTHNIRKVTQMGEVTIENFLGSVSLNIQPVLLNSLVQSDEWVSVVRDKVLRYYHLIRPAKPKSYPPQIKLEWGEDISSIQLPPYKGKLWYQLISIGLTQWSYARINEHIPDLLKACASLDGRKTVNRTDYKLLIKLLQPLQLERYLINTYGFEQGRVFDNNLYCILVELSSFKLLTLNQICEDYKVSPQTSERLIETVKDWAWIKANSPKKVMPTDKATQMLKLCGVNQKW